MRITFRGGPSAEKKRIYPRQGESEEWMKANPVLGDGEIGVVTDMEQIFIGDGKTRWLDLEPATGGELYDLILNAVKARKL